ncbi:kinetochore protein Spc25-like [Ciona intestinalis]
MDVQSLLAEIQDESKKQADMYKVMLEAASDKALEKKPEYLELHDVYVRSRKEVEEKFAKNTELEKTLAELKVVNAEMEKRQEDIETRICNLREQLEENSKKKQEIVEKNENERQKIKEQSELEIQGLEFYQMYMGLEVHTLRNNRVQFLFYNVFPDDSAPLFVIVRMDGKTYHITDSEPPLENLQQLEDRLNETNNLAGFIQHAREKLKEKANILKEN